MAENKAGDTAPAPKKAAPKADPDNGLKHFQGTVLKRNADGDEVLSDHLDDGEQVAGQPSAGDSAK